jgi:LacI family trehalose operon transcriptional repressor
MQNRLTIKDIARLSGVGKSTVSRVLNNESGVSERTRERVEAVMNQHGFSPPAPHAPCVGKVTKWSPLLSRAWIPCRKPGRSDHAARLLRAGYDPIMMESQFSPQMVEEHLGMLQRRNIDGVVLFGLPAFRKRC